MKAPEHTARPDLTRYAWLSICAGVTTLALKTLAWRLTGSVGLLSDALESIVNVVAAVVALWVLRVAAAPPDKEHEHGHHKAEYFSSGLEGALIFVAAIAIVVSAVPRLFAPQPLEAVGVGLAVSGFASLVNLVVGRMLIARGRQHRSITLAHEQLENYQLRFGRASLGYHQTYRKVGRRRGGRVTHRWLAVFLVLAACKAKTDPEDAPAPRWPDDGPSRQPDRTASGEGFAFGAPSKEGLAVGLKVEPVRLRKGEPLQYWIAFTNHGKTTIQRRLFDDNDFVYPRTMLVAVRAGDRREMVGRAVGWNEASSAGFGIDIAVEPGETKERQGNLFPLPTDLASGADLMIVFGGPAYSFDIESGRVHVDVEASH